MALIIKQCPCGREFEAKTKHKVYCSDCLLKRILDSNSAAKKRYNQTERGKEKRKEYSRASYLRHREENIARIRAYYEAHKEERKAYLRRRYAEQHVPTCIRCKRTFERQGTERLCVECQSKQAEREAKKRRAREAIKREQKRALESNLAQKNAMPATPLQPALPTEKEKLAMMRAALARFRAA